MSDRYVAIHQNPQGPGDGRPTASQIVQNEGLCGKWNDKTVFITGCSSGIGIETTKAMATTGATLFLTARNLDKARTALGSLADQENVHILELDLESLASVRSCAAKFNAMSKRLNVFIANAGVMLVPEGRTIDGFETQFGTNHLAHFLLFQLLTPTLIASSRPDFASRAIFLSSTAHRFARPDFDNPNLEGCYNAFTAYQASKLSNLWTANEVNRRYGAQGLHAWSVNPGEINTDLHRHMTEEQRAFVATIPHAEEKKKSPAQGAATTVWGSVSKALEGQGGRYLDNCQIIHAHRDEHDLLAPGYSSEHAYDEDAERQLWELSLRMVDGVGA